MRQRAAASDVVIVNHHLLCADLAVRHSAFGEVIPACGHAIIDEAHQLEDIATQYFGLSVSNYRLEDFARDVERFAGKREEILRVVARVRDQARVFFAALAASHRGRGDEEREERVRATAESLVRTEEAAATLSGALDHVEAVVALSSRGDGGGGDPQPDAEADDRATLTRRAGEIRDELRFLVRAADPAYV